MIRYTGILFTESAYPATILNDESMDVRLNCGTTTLYSRSGSATPYTHTETIDTTPLQDAPETFNASSDAIGYADGACPTTFPSGTCATTWTPTKSSVSKPATTSSATATIVLSVNKLEKIGKGIYNSDVEIVSDIDDEKELYCVGASIHILSWKLANQNVSLCSMQTRGQDTFGILYDNASTETSLTIRRSATTPITTQATKTRHTRRAALCEPRRSIYERRHPLPSDVL